MHNSQTFCLVKKIMKDKMRVKKKERKKKNYRTSFLVCNLLFLRSYIFKKERDNALSVVIFF